MANDTYEIKYVKGVGEKRAQLLKKLGIDNIDALLRFYPRSYLDFSTIYPIYSAPIDVNVCIKAKIISPVKEVHYKHSRLTVYTFRISDNSGEATVTLYNTKYLAESLKQGAYYLLYGKVTENLIEREIKSPIIKTSDQVYIHPVYPLTAGITSAQIGKIVKNALSVYKPIDPLPEYLREKYALCDIERALYNIHFPTSLRLLEEAKKRLVFEELFVLQTAFAMLKDGSKTETAVIPNKDYTAEFFDKLPFEPTNAQRRATNECITDIMSGAPMNRLIQGDVGSGKTAVAAALCYNMAKNGLQAAIMAPTEILAEQHFSSFCRFFEGTGIKCGLLTGSMTLKQKNNVKAALLSGEIDIAIGTHALISDNVAFKNLSLVVTDEQHRFGVMQRAKLSQKGNAPHRLVMSATPIPRSLALIIYGDLDISIVDEYPKNRQVIESYSVTPSYRPRIYNFLKKHIDQGRQCYIVCPLVEENESQLISAEEYFEKISKEEFADYSVGLLHGKMKAKDKEQVMEFFKNGEIDLLVCTTVIEVGIDVPNATVMVIENAERFGLSQLHQLRGRIGRGEFASTCIFVSPAKNNARLSIMCKTANGFEIADQDLKLRGPGDFIGQRQHGLPMLKIADLSNDMELLKLTSNAASLLIKEDKHLQKHCHSGLKTEVQKILSQTDVS